MFRFMVAPDCCGRRVVRTVALRMPNFSMSDGRYVSTGFGPTSCAVGMFEPVTITRSTSITPEAAVSCANVFASRPIKHPSPAMTAAPKKFDLWEAFISDPSGSGERDYTELSQNLQR